MPILVQVRTITKLIIAMEVAITAATSGLTATVALMQRLGRAMETTVCNNQILRRTVGDLMGSTIITNPTTPSIPRTAPIALGRGLIARIRAARIARSIGFTL